MNIKDLKDLIADLPDNMLVDYRDMNFGGRLRIYELDKGCFFIEHDDRSNSNVLLINAPLSLESCD